MPSTKSMRDNMDVLNAINEKGKFLRIEAAECQKMQHEGGKKVRMQSPPSTSTTRLCHTP